MLLAGCVRIKATRTRVRLVFEKYTRLLTKTSVLRYQPLDKAGMKNTFLNDAKIKKGVSGDFLC